MKTYYICAAVIFLVAYSVFHFGFRTGGDGQLYRINNSVAFLLQTPDENFNGVTIRSVSPTNAFVRFIGGAYQVDNQGAVDMPHVNYRQGDFIYTGVPQNEWSTADIINIRTGEIVNADVPKDFKFGDDVSKLPEYKQRGLVKTDENKLTQGYVKNNFEHLSTFTDRCLYAHLIFAVAALLLAFPKVSIALLGAFFQSFDPA